MPWDPRAQRYRAKSCQKIRVIIARSFERTCSSTITWNFIYDDLPDLCDQVIGLVLRDENCSVASSYGTTRTKIEIGPHPGIGRTAEPTVLYQLDDGAWEFGHKAIEMQKTSHDGQLFRDFFSRDKSGDETLLVKSTSGGAVPLLLLVETLLRIFQKVIHQNISEVAQWVITVPLSWNANQRRFVRKAAVQAGLVENEYSNALLIVSEFVAACVAVHGSETDIFRSEEILVVLDCEANTTTVSTCKVVSTSPLEVKRMGDTITLPGCGEVLSRFKSFLRELVTHLTAQEEDLAFELDQVYSDFQRLAMVFQSSNDPGSIRLSDILETKKQLVALTAAYNQNHPNTPILNTGLSRNGFLSMSKELMLSFYEPLLEELTSAVAATIAQYPDATIAVVPVGEGAAYRAVIERLQTSLEDHNKMRVVECGNGCAQMAIPLGAVRCGLHASQLHFPRALATYNLVVDQRTPTSVVTVGDIIEIGTTLQFSFLPCDDEDSQDMLIRVLRGEDVVVQLVVDCPEDSIRNSREVTVTLTFAKYHLDVRVENARGANDV